MRTLVNIITEEDPLPAYLFIKEKYKKGDCLMFISPRDEAEQIAFLTQRLHVLPDEVVSVVLKNDSDEYTYERICRCVRGFIKPDMEYLVNLAGGTRYMALAVQQVFEGRNSQYFYTQTHENLIVSTIFDDSIFDNDDVILPIKYRLTLAEYLSLHGLTHDLNKCSHRPTQMLQQSKNFFDLFAHNRLRGSDYQVVELLRENYRGRKAFHLLSEMESPTSSKLPAIPDIHDFLGYLHFVPAVPDRLSRSEIEYITGGWFEEYVYYLVQEHLHPQEIAIGVHVSQPSVGKHNNELDVVFLRANMLFVIECKTGVQNDRMFNEIVYKACALKEALLGLVCHSYIFSLKKDDDGYLHKVANYMDVEFCDYHCLSNPEAVAEVFDKIRNMSHV